MKLNINGYEVEIKARLAHVRSRMNNEDTYALLNDISLYVSRGGDDMKRRNANGLAKEAYEIGKDIFDALKKAGYYDD